MCSHFSVVGSLLGPIAKPQADSPMMTIVLLLILIGMIVVILLLDGVSGLFLPYWTSRPQVTFDGNAI